MTVGHGDHLHLDLDNSTLAHDGGLGTCDAVARTTAGAAPVTGPAAPIAGKTYDIKMLGDEAGYRFDPVSLTIKVGDAVKFINVTGGPHNVVFSGGTPGSLAQLDANMPSQTGDGPSVKIGELSGPLLTSPNDTYTVSFGRVKPGTYTFICLPHNALGMKGAITVQ